MFDFECQEAFVKRVGNFRSLLAIIVFCAAIPATLAAQQFKTAVEFDGTNGGNPVNGPLAQGPDGSFYGTTQFGGDYSCGSVDGCGTIFKVSPTGKLTTLYTFCAKSNCADGASPLGGLVLATDGNFYGTTYLGGSNCILKTGACGSVFKVTPAGELTTLYSFCSKLGCGDGAGPVAALIQGVDGDLYGATSIGGSLNCDTGCGTVFRITPGGNLTTLFLFGLFSTDGINPYAPLVQGNDGNFYGTTAQGGNACLEDLDGCGIVFQLTPQGSERILYSFCADYFSCVDGGSPYAGLVQASDGDFYGTTSYSNAGTIFRITPQGALTTLYKFCSLPNCTDGGGPDASLIQATNGALYGTTAYEGDISLCQDIGCGTIFEFTLANGLRTLHTFQSSDGQNPESPLTQSTAGFFVGTTYQGGASDKCFFVGCGTVYGVSTGLHPFVAFVN